MGSSNALGWQVKGQLLTGGVNLETNQIKIALMQQNFQFDPQAHTNYTDVSASELPSGNGYATGGALLSGGAVSINNNTGQATAAWNPVSWLAAGGSIGPTRGAVIYVVSSGLIVGFIDLGQTITQQAGGSLTIQNISVIAQ